MNKNKFGQLLFTLCLCVAGAGLFDRAYAGAVGTTGAGVVPGCDADIYVAHANRGLLEGRREIVANQTFIRKPDSILEYTCFVDMLDPVVGDQIAPIFSESDLWVDRDVELLANRPEVVEINFELGPDSMNEALADTVILHAGDYIGANFGHTYLGGLADGDVGEAGVPCGVMAPVWHLAKSFDFDREGLFLSFEELIDIDTRELPEPTDDTGITGGIIDIAFSPGTEDGGMSIPPTFIIDYLLPESPCEPTVYTGITTHVIIAPDRVGELETFEDGICIAPGCYYTLGGDYGGGAGECVR